MSFFISEAMAQAPAAASGASQGAGWEGLIFPIGLVIILYFFNSFALSLATFSDYIVLCAFKPRVCTAI